MKLRVVAVTLLAVIAALALNVLGIARFPGGPLREWKDGGILWLDMWPSDWGNNVGSNTADAAWARPDSDLVYTSDLSSNDWPWPVEIERVTPMDGSGHVAISQWLVRRPDRPGSADLWAMGPLTPDQQAILGADFAPLPGSVPSGDGRHQFAALIRGPQQGSAGWETLAVDYRVGPFTFRVIHHDALQLCLGDTAAERTCSTTP